MAEHFGDPFREQRVLAAGDAVVVFDGAQESSRGVIRLTGPDRLSWLDSVVSQDVGTLAVGESTEALLLDANGRIERAMHVLDDGTATWLIVERDAPGLAVWLDRMVFRRKVEVVDVSSEYTVIGFFDGGCAAPIVASLTAAPNGVALTWIDPWSHVSLGGWQYANGGTGVSPHPAAGWAYLEALLPAGTALPGAPAGSPTQAGTLALEALRIAAWRPAIADVDETSIPHEFDWLRSAVHLSKGCYRGQETVAKVHNLGHPPRRLVALDLDGSEVILPEHGWSVALAEDPTNVVGHITSASRHFEEGPIALALIKRSVAVDASLIVMAPDGTGQPIAANQTVIVPPDAGKTANVPRITRDRVRPTRS